MQPKHLCLVLLSRAFVTALTIAAPVALADTADSMGEAPIPLGTVSTPVPVTCPSGFYSGMTCRQATVDCSHLGIPNIDVTYGRKNPTGTLKGTIVMHGGHGGTVAFDAGPTGQSKTYVGEYLANGYRVVQLAWASDWETIGSPGDIKFAACRPATILDHIYDTIYLPLAVGGMCAQGHSAGSAALAYVLAWYDAASYLDKILLTAGPPFGEVEQGCLVPEEATDVTVCPTGQFGCIGTPWTVNPTFSNASRARTWTGYPTCVTPNPPQADRDAWKAMSIVDGVNGAFGHAETALSAWLGSSASNNESGLGQFYYAQFTAANQTAPYSVNRVDGMPDNQIWNGVTVSGDSAFTASVKDMRSPVTGCIKRHP